MMLYKHDTVPCPLHKMFALSIRRLSYKFLCSLGWSQVLHQFYFSVMLPIALYFPQLILISLYSCIKVGNFFYLWKENWLYKNSANALFLDSRVESRNKIIFASNKQTYTHLFLKLLIKITNSGNCSWNVYES